MSSVILTIFNVWCIHISCNGCGGDVERHIELSIIGTSGVLIILLLQHLEIEKIYPFEKCSIWIHLGYLREIKYTVYLYIKEMIRRVHSLSLISLSSTISLFLIHSKWILFITYSGIQEDPFLH